MRAEERSGLFKVEMRIPVPSPEQMVPGETICVVVIDDEELARSILRECRASYREIQIVGECANGFEAVMAAAELDRSADARYSDAETRRI